MKTQTKLIALAAVAAIAAGVAFGVLQRPEVPQAQFVALDTDGQVARAFGNVSVTPTTYLLDRSGRIVAKYVGEPDWKDFHARIERALAEAA